MEERLLLLDRGSPEQLLKDSQTIRGQLIRALYHDYCMRTREVSDRILLHECVQYFS